MEEKRLVDTEIEGAQNELKKILEAAISTNQKTNENDFNRVNKKLNNLKSKLERIITAIEQFRELTIDMRHVLYIYDNRDKNKPTNRLIKKVIKIVIRKSDGSLRFVVSKDDV